MVTLKSILFVIGAIIMLVAIAGVVMMAFHVLSMCAHDKNCDDPASAADIDIPESAEEYRVGSEEPYDIVSPAKTDSTADVAGVNPNDDGQDPDNNTMTADPEPIVKKKIRRKKKTDTNPAE